MKKILSFLFVFCFAKTGFSQWQQVSDPARPNDYYLNNFGSAGIGNLGSSYNSSAGTTLLDVGNAALSGTVGATAGRVTGIQSRQLYNDNGIKYGNLFYLEQGVANSNPVATFSSYASSSQVSGTVSLMTSIQARTEHRAISGAILWSRGVSSSGLVSSSGNVTNWASFYGGGLELTSTGTVTDAYGVYLASFPASGITRRWGIYSEDVNATSYFAGKVKIDNAGGFQFVPGAGAGKVLTSDPSGNAYWGTASGGCSTCWSLGGNAGVGAGDYIGPINSTAFNIKIAGEPYGKLDPINHNNFYGHHAGNGNTIGQGNIAMGEEALATNQNGFNNTAIGTGADVSTDYIYGATAIGYQATVTESNAIQLGGVHTGNVYVGVAGNPAKLVTPYLQVTVGGGGPATGKVLTSDASGNATWQAVPPGTDPNAWSINGNASATDANFIGPTYDFPFNIKIGGVRAGRIDPSTSHNTSFGLAALSNVTTPGHTQQLTAIGYLALFYNSTNPALGGEANTGVGANTLYYNITGNANTAVGVDALRGLPSFTSGGEDMGDANTAVGANALRGNTSRWNTAVGCQALTNNLTGEGNTAVGIDALHDNNYTNISSTGNNNVAVGMNALYKNVTGSTLTAIGNDADINDATQTYFNSTAVGYQAIINGNNKVVLGNSFTTDVDAGTANIYHTSDGRFKTNLNEDGIKGLEFIKRLRPVEYNFDTKKYTEFLTKRMPDSIRKTYLTGDFSKSAAIHHSGFIAQEVEKAANETGYDFDGLHKPENRNDHYSLAYSQFVVPLVKSVQELSKQNDDQSKEIADLKKELEELKALVKGKTEGSIKLDANSDAQLFQNAPNPFNRSTVIRYSLPFTAKKAVLKITSISGVSIKEFNLVSKAQSVEINGGELSAGTYVYSLFVDDVFIDSKQMILTK